METWTMVGAKRARNAERPTQPSLDLTSRAPWFYPDPPVCTVVVSASGRRRFREDRSEDWFGLHGLVSWSIDV